ncbi:MAG: hypothetical protein HQK54_12355 [Oligoflexales bacterium]|nr:hypothetical protein [Oligoflexales bacterium]
MYIMTIQKRKSLKILGILFFSISSEKFIERNVNIDSQSKAYEILFMNLRKKVFVILFFLFFQDLAMANRLNILIEKWPIKHDYVKAITLESAFIGFQVYDTLLTKLPSGEIVPNLVESWEFDKNRVVYKFRLRKNVFFSDGSPLTVEDIKFFFENSELVRKSAIRKPSDSFKKSVHFLKVNENEFEVKLSIDDARFLDNICDVDNKLYKLNNKGNQIGTGAYYVAEINESKKQIILKKNIYTDIKLDFTEVMITTESRRPIDLSFSKNLKEIEDPIPLSYFDTEVHYLGIFASNPKYLNREKRLYLLSLLKDDIIEMIEGKQKYPIGGIIPFGQLGYDQNISKPFSNIKKTKIEYPVNVVYYADFHSRISIAYCDELRKNGIQCNLKKIPAEEYETRANNGELEVYFIRQKSTNFHSEYFLSCFSSDSVYNYSFSKKKIYPLQNKYDRMFSEVYNTPFVNQDLIEKNYQKMDQSLLNDGLVKPFKYGGEKNIWHSKRIELPTINTMGPFGIKVSEIRLLK